jgi:glycosyltransferase involved in cell wall biosynthesis
MAVSSPLRVLHVYSGNLYGGIETFLRALAEERHQCPEMQPEFALCFEGRIADEIRASGAPLHMLGGVRLSRPWSVMSAQRKLAKVLRARRPDVVVCHAAWPYAIFSSVIRAAKTRLVFYRHDIGGARDWMNKLAGRVQPDVVIANSHYTAKHAYPKFEGVEQHVVYPVVRPAKTNPGDRERIRKELGAEENDVVILQASRMQEWKGQALLIEALALLPKDLSWKCWFAGDAQRDFEKAYVSKLKGRVANLNLSERVQFLGQRNDVPALMQGADIFCQPNLSPEPFGIVFVEALAAGLPVVTTEVAGGALEILDAKCSRISLAKSARVEASLNELVTSESSRRDLSVQARKRARIFVDPGTHLKGLPRALAWNPALKIAPRFVMEQVQQ